MVISVIFGIPAPTRSANKGDVKNARKTDNKNIQRNYTQIYYLIDHKHTYMERSAYRNLQ